MIVQKTERFEARITPEQKDLIQTAADLSGRSLTDFIVQSAQQEAVRTIESMSTIRLSLAEQRKFVDALINPPKPGRRLKAAWKRYQQRKVL